MPLLDALARGVAQTLNKDDFRRIMNDTLDHMLRIMSRRERVEFINDMVTNAVSKMLTGLSSEEKAGLLRDLLPGVLSQFPTLSEELERNRVAPSSPSLSTDMTNDHAGDAMPTTSDGTEV